MPTTKDNQSDWYKDAVFYSLPLHSFYDSNGDGVGDVNGLIQKLDYLEDLGVSCISLLPFYDSPLRDAGYDVIDHYRIHPSFGNTEQFKNLLEAAHKRGLKVVIDLVLNHTSIDHPWFQRARLLPAFSPEREYYVWSDRQDLYQEARVLFTDSETSNWEWDNIAQAYYWHRFFHHQADLNYENETVRREMREVIDYWLGMGVDGLRLIGLAFLFRAEGTDSENLPRVHDYLRELRQHVDRKHPGKILIAETDLWPEDSAQYFGKGDECQMNYHYALMPRLFMALQTEDRYPIVDILEQTPSIPEDCQWGLLLRNHDDMALSMVTEEERDYLYRSFAQDTSARINQGIRRRLAPMLDNDRRKIELMYALLFSLPGTPVLYYGEEIGMGDNIYLGDRKGVRTPMQWSSDRNAGFSSANPQKLFLPVISDPLYRYESVNVENQQRNPASMLWWVKTTLALRRRFRAFGRGQTTFLDTHNNKVLAFLREYEGEKVLVLANLSKQPQALEIDLSANAGAEPTEIFSQNKFFAIGQSPYRFTLGPYGYHWFMLEAGEEEEQTPKERAIPDIEVDRSWEKLFRDYSARRMIEKKVLPPYLRSCRWFAGKSRKIISAEIGQAAAVPLGDSSAYLLLINLRYADGLPETYFLPAMMVTEAEEIVHYLKKETGSVICYLKMPQREGILIDAIYHEAFRNELFWMIKQDRTLSSDAGLLEFEAGKILSGLEVEKEDVRGDLLRAEQSNTSVIYNDQFFFKIYRKPDADVNPDLELVRFLSERTDFQNSPRYGGGIQLTPTGQRISTVLGLLQDKIPNQGEAWTAMLRKLAGYYERILGAEKVQPPSLVRGLYLRKDELPAVLHDFIDEETIEQVQLLARRTGEMHIALASDPIDPDFRPEPFTRHYQRSIYSGHRKLVSEKLDALNRRLDYLPPAAAAEARQVLSLRPTIVQAFRDIYGRKIDAVKTRIHGDYHLGQVLFTGNDFFIIDFEGEPLLSISERRLKRTPFKDVAGMLRSFHYAAYGQLLLNTNYRTEDMPRLEQWARQWFHYISRFFLAAYLDTVRGQAFVPTDEADVQLLLRIYSLEKAIYEVGYEMNSRPNWLRIPLRGVLYLLEEYPGREA